jgi:hypothetical protein
MIKRFGAITGACMFDLDAFRAFLSELLFRSVGYALDKDGG